ncbi:MAG: hypothetical protein GW903_09605 [Alphaproteobacteria bacterium]|nr:hypothetical protein [Alphaproteobacteria bacterium]NCQ89199.1 hypothetical protein [Alphaproteobacteria bacterium]NCT08125.1 hypothetical protein [Alphaproteobacteria bacterium]
MTLITLSANNVTPMFSPAMKREFMAQQPKTQTQELSIFDVKELYDLAYDQKAKGASAEKFQALMADALQLDMAYRRQLAKNNPYRQIKRSANKQESTETKVA